MARDRLSTANAINGPPRISNKADRKAISACYQGGQNGGVTNSKISGWKGFCKYPPDQEVNTEGGPINYVGSTVYTTIYYSTTITLNVMDYSFTKLSPPAGDAWALTTNPCYPSILTKDPGFALLTWDPYYGRVNNPLPYSVPPTPYYANGKTKPSKRCLDRFNDAGEEFLFDEYNSIVLVDEGHSTRKALESELRQHFNLATCKTRDCEAELAEWAELEQVLREEAGIRSAPVQQTGESTLTSTADASAPTSYFLGQDSSPAGSVLRITPSSTFTAEVEGATRTASTDARSVTTEAPNLPPWDVLAGSSHEEAKQRKIHRHLTKERFFEVGR
ncbi:hypothetical protein MMC25_005301 [Agyrium rufum]|nr:hypothetical protein [Agyrium rufum]